MARSAPEFVKEKPVTGEGITLDPNRDINSNREVIDREFGATAFLVGMIRAGTDHKFAIIDVRDTKSEVPFVLANTRNRSHRVAVEPDKSVTVFRHKKTLRHPIKGVKENYFSVAYDSEYDQFHVRGHHPKIGTFVTGHEVQPDTEQDGVQAQFTTNLRDALQGDELYQTAEITDLEAPHGRYNGHPIIGNLSRSMRDGVYGTTHSEQIHVDDKERVVSALVGQIVNELQVLKTDPNTSQRTLLRAVQDEVAALMKYDLPAVEKMSSPYYESRGMIHLSEYLKAQVGVCRQQAVFAALIMQDAIEKGVLQGSVGVQRNHDIEANGAHAWAVFRDRENHAIIVDPAQHFVGTRDEAKSDPRRWRYYIPDDSE